jgi:hypothetical protein
MQSWESARPWPCPLLVTQRQLQYFACGAHVHHLPTMAPHLKVTPGSGLAWQLRQGQRVIL